MSLPHNIKMLKIRNETERVVEDEVNKKETQSIINAMKSRKLLSNLDSSKRIS